jgi:hypothetical protein
MHCAGLVGGPGWTFDPGMCLGADGRLGGRKLVDVGEASA